MKKFLLCLTLAFAIVGQVFAQKDVSSMTKNDIMKLTYDELLEMPFEDVMKLADIMGVSMDDLFAMIMNKSVSSASKKAEDSFKSPLSSTVITKAEIRSYGISSIEEALRLIPGMIVQEKTNGMYDVHIRGLNNIPDNQMMLYTENSNILLMIDGRIAHNYATGNLNFDILPIGVEDIERIEVVRGANSALYGPNAVTGVINIITEKPSENSKTLQGSMMMGTQENYIGDVAFRKNINKKLSVGITANLQYRRRNTNQLYVYPTHGLYYSKMSDAEKYYFKDGMSKGQMAYLMGMVDAEGNPYNPPVVNADGSVTLIPDLSKAKLIDASQGGYYDATDIKNLKQAFTFGAIAEQIPDALKVQILEIQKGKYEQSPDAFLHNYGSEPSAATVEAFLGGLANNLPYSLYEVIENQGDITEMLEDPGMSRKTYGFNSYLNYRPSEDMNFDVSFGYQHSRVGATPIGEIPFLLCERESKTGYFNLNSSIYGLSLNASYMGGVQDYQKGKPGFKVFMNNLQVNAEYDIKLGDLSVVPGLAYYHVWQTDYIPDYINPNDPSDFRWEYHDHDYKFTSSRHLSGSQGGEDAKLTDFAPSLRLDYRLGDFRVLGAVRFDKTNIPDEWNPSYQIAANYSINENNLVRASFGTAKRSANIINSSAKYTWYRDGLMPPDTIYFKGDKNAPLTKIRNAELGYRWRPTEKILVDAEAYYSISEDYGALKAYQSQVIMPSEKLNAFMTNPEILKSLRSITEGDLDMEALSAFMANSSVISTIKYDKLPYKVNQMGFGVNIDWIISKKLIAKVNANIQKTTIDNYYAYNQNAEILGQLGQIFGMITNVPSLAEDLQTDAINELMASGTFTEQQLMKVLGVHVDENGNQTPIPVDFESDDFKRYFGTYQKYLGRAMGDIDHAKVAEITAAYIAAEDKAEFLNTLKTSENNTEYAAYYALKYGVYNDDGIFTFGDSKPYETPTENGHVHKATPSFYGMVGLIYKPTPKIDITAYGNYLGKRTYATKYNMGDDSVELKDRFTLSMKLAYKPVPGMEVFLNGHNMLNNEQREFPYGDKIGGIYSVGISFGF
ncbi:MAG: TonB-dependent receptor plug domain-containing protein [Salinivirgaceae bacterium]|nr:TonB-dependent receptor plug domain-containing protein [Salinivirgaceae bacterium]